jgi:hypothetical protein
MSEVTFVIVQVVPDKLPGETEAVNPLLIVTVKVAWPLEAMPDTLIGETEPPAGLTTETVTVYVGILDIVIEDVPDHADST